jgi:peptide deformylase
VLRIVTYPHPALRFESVPVQRIDATLRDHVRAMFDLMYEARGIGLAANQVALPFRLFVLNLTADPERKDEERVFINPEIVKRHGGVVAEEGCLSFPGLFGNVPRARTIRVRAFDLQGNPVEVHADDLLSRAIQHETDHVHGRLFIDHFDPDTRKAADAAIREIEARFRAEQQAGAIPPDDRLADHLRALSAAATPSAV